MPEPRAVSDASKRRRQRAWYARHRDQINAKRKSRYQRDRNHRLTHQARCRKQYRQRKALQPVVAKGLRRKPQWVVFRIGNQAARIPTVTVGFFARQLGVAIRVLHRWEAYGIVPSLNWRSSGTRLFPMAFIDACVEILGTIRPRRGPGAREANKQLCAQIVKLWNEKKLVYLKDPNFGLDRITSQRLPLGSRVRHAAKA